LLGAVTGAAVAAGAAVSAGEDVAADADVAAGADVAADADVAAGAGAAPPPPQAASNIDVDAISAKYFIMYDERFIAYSLLGRTRNKMGYIDVLLGKAILPCALQCVVLCEIPSFLHLL
jgi:hypothetical protein